MITEIDKLLDAGFIEKTYPEWISNVVTMKKTNDKWKICINFINLNQACPKESYLLLRIDQMVDAASWTLFMTITKSEWLLKKRKLLLL